MAAAAFNASADATAAAAATCHQHGMPAVGGSRPPAAPGRAPGGFGLYLASPRGNSNASGGLHVAAAAAGPVGAMVSGPGGAGGFDAAAADGSGSGRKRGRRSASHVQGGLALDVGGVKRPRVSGAHGLTECLATGGGCTPTECLRAWSVESVYAARCLHGSWWSSANAGDAPSLMAAVHFWCSRDPCTFAVSKCKTKKQQPALPHACQLLR